MSTQRIIEMEIDMADPITVAAILEAFGKGAGAALIRKVFSKNTLESAKNVYYYFFGKNKSGEHLAGIWEGIFTQKINGRDVDHAMLIQFVTKGRKDVAVGVSLYWKSSIKNPREDQMTPLLFTGSYHEKGFVRLDFKNVDENVAQFGTVIASISGHHERIGRDRAGKGKALWTAVARDSTNLTSGGISLVKRTKETPLQILQKHGAANSS